MLPLTEKMVGLLKDNNIKGAVVLVMETDDGMVTISHAVNNVHKMNVCLGMGIVAREYAPRGEFGDIINNAADTIIKTVRIVGDLR